MEDLLLKRIMSSTTTIDDFNFDALSAPPLLSMLSLEDINYFHKLATSIRYSSNINYKYSEIDKIMKMRGFVLLSRGTNRVVYRCLENQDIVIKIAIDDVGIKDNPREFRNQFHLKPFVCKIFEVSPCGTVAVVERVYNIKSREEFASVGGDVYDLLSKFILGKYVLDDIGSRCFMNYGTRLGFGVVLLDYPYMYELDGNKLYCQEIIDDHICDGVIDYDDSFDNLVCSKCGRKYLAKELEKAVKNNEIIEKGKVDFKMKVTVRRGNSVVKIVDDRNTSKKITKREKIYNSLPSAGEGIVVRTNKPTKGSLANAKMEYKTVAVPIKFNVSTNRDNNDDKNNEYFDDEKVSEVVKEYFDNDTEIVVEGHSKSNNVEEFDTSSTFIPKSEADEIEESVDNNVDRFFGADDTEELVDAVVGAIFDTDEIESDDEYVEETDDVEIEEDVAPIPVGATPVGNKKRSKRFDPEFYGSK